MNTVTKYRIALSIAFTLGGCGLLYFARYDGNVSELMADTLLLVAATSCALFMIGSGIGNIFRRPFIGGLAGLGLYVLYMSQCALRCLVTSQ